jgi:arabinofuranan 3-O-arabinosyltransferase
VAIHDVTLPPPLRDDAIARAARIAFFVILVVQAGVGLGSLIKIYGEWLAHASGPGATDFVNVWAAGRLTLEGRPAAAYDWDIHRQMESVAIGREIESYFGWHYPPPFLAIAAILASFSYAAAYFLWVATTSTLYVATMRGIYKHRAAYLLAVAFPAVFPNMMLGQNGFLTAALMGGTLGLMERRPMLAGCCLGLLTYKPHFGLLFPIVLVVSGRWTVFFTAAVVATALALGSWYLFGFATWEAFFHWLPTTSNVVLSAGQADWSKLQSIFGLVRIAGGSETLGWSLMIVATLLMTVAVSLLWRSHSPFDLKAAALVTASVLVTPYVYAYDLVILAIAVSFFIRNATLSGLSPGEYFALTVIFILLASIPFLMLPLAVPAAAIMGLLIVLRSIDATAQPSKQASL